MKGERGVHRLVRLSPFDADHARHTSFALLEVLPEVEEGVDVTIDLNEVRIDVFRAGARGRAKRPEELHGGPYHAPAHGNYREVPERALPVPEQGRSRCEFSWPASWKGTSNSGTRRSSGSKVSTSPRSGAIRFEATSLHPYRMVKDHRDQFRVFRCGRGAGWRRGRPDQFLSDFNRRTSDPRQEAQKS